MKIKFKSSEERKLYGYILIIFTIVVIITVLVTIYIIKSYRKSMFEFINTTLANVSEKYPDSKNDIVNDVFKEGLDTNSKDVLSLYSINMDNIDFNLNNVSLSTRTIVPIIFLSSVIFILFICLIIAYIKAQERKLEKITNYSDEILNGKYSMDLRDNDEGSISILKNKIYDITVMLNEKNIMLEESKKSMEKLIADISHQIKTPLTSLNIINELLYNDDIPREKKIQFLDDMQKQLSKIEWLLKTILNLAKLDSKTINISKDIVNLKELLEKCKNTFDILCESMGCKIHILVDSKINVVCDLKWTKEAINNIIKNAIEHGSKDVFISAEENNLYTRISIKDNGEGIDKEDIVHIFDRFYKAQNSKENSVGLGLAFTKSIISNQDGDIRVKSKSGVGTEFIIKLYKD